MRSRSLSVSAAGLLIVGVLVALAPSASAASHKIFVGPSPIGNNKNCAHPKYNSIQAAVTAAAPGKIIVVCAGTYNEQVVVSKNLTIQGAGTGFTFVQIPASVGARTNSVCNPAVAGVNQQDIFDICGAGVSVSLSGLTVEGPWGPSVYADCSVAPTGIAVMGGASLNLHNAIVTNIAQDPLNGCQGGVGIRVGRLGTTQVGHATITNTAVTGYQKGGVVASYTGSTLTMSHSTISGVGATPNIAQNGLQINDQAKGKIMTSIIEGNECDDFGAGCGSDVVNDIQSFGVLLLDPAPGTTIDSSTIQNNDGGLYNDSPTGSDPKVTNTTISNNRYVGMTLDEGAFTSMGNAISGSPTGVEVISYNGQAVGPAASVTGSSISGATTAVSLGDDGSVGYPQASLTLTKDDLSSGNGYGVDNTDGSAVNATKDFWGGTHGPSDWSIGTGTGVSQNVDFFPWATTGALNTFSACTFSGSVNVVGVANGIYCGTVGNNTMVVTGAAGPILIMGNGGTDSMTATGAGAHYFIGGSGNDTITSGGNANDHAQGRGGSDTITGVATTSP